VIKVREWVFCDGCGRDTLAVKSHLCKECRARIRQHEETPDEAEDRMDDGSFCWDSHCLLEVTRDEAVAIDVQFALTEETE
jgi:hypothetical protein